jgi:hypothetical protein
MADWLRGDCLPELVTRDVADVGTGDADDRRHNRRDGLNWPVRYQRHNCEGNYREQDY